jgi:hypothetical protein
LSLRYFVETASAKKNSNVAVPFFISSVDAEAGTKAEGLLLLLLLVLVSVLFL